MRNHRLYLKDIFEAMVAVQSFIEGMDFNVFVEDDKTTSAVVRKLEIIGEAAKNDNSAEIPTSAVAADGRDARPDYSCILCS